MYLSRLCIYVFICMYNIHVYIITHIYHTPPSEQDIAGIQGISSHTQHCTMVKDRPHHPTYPSCRRLRWHTRQCWRTCCCRNPKRSSTLTR